MKPLSIAVATLAAALSLSAFAGDPVVGKQKATACVVCHGSENFGGIFYTLQLAGRNADKLAIKTNKYKTLKILHPMMNMATAFYTEKDIEDVSAYYQSIGKPFLTAPFITIKGDDDQSAGAGAPNSAPTSAPIPPSAAAPMVPAAAWTYPVATK